MGQTTPITLSEAARRLGRSRHLVRFLVRDRQIPCCYAGSAKVIDAAGFRALKAALAEFEAKPEPASA